MLLGAPLESAAQRAGSVPKVGFLGALPLAADAQFAAFRDEMRVLGYVEGRNYVLDARSADGDFERLPPLAAEIVKAKVDVILTANPGAIRAAQAATKTIPIVMMVHDPVEMGFVASLARPGGNITGMSFQEQGLATKRLDLLSQAVPGLQRVAILWNKEGGYVNAIRDVEAAARAKGMQTLVLELRESGQFADAVAQATEWRAQAVVQVASPYVYRNRAVLIALLQKNRLPASCELRQYVVEGCLMTYSASFPAIFRRLAHYVDRILKGASPAELPVEQPSEFEFVINAETAAALGLSIPTSLRLMASEVIR
jgi:putative ABC transport system substrate-binding protein